MRRCASTAPRERAPGFQPRLGARGAEVAGRHRLERHLVGLLRDVTLSCLAVEGAIDYPDVCARLLSWATVSAAVCPRWLLDEHPGWEPLKAAFPAAAVVAPPELHVWATCLASALTHRGRLSADDVRTFTMLYEDLMPRLPGLIDEPVPARS